MEEFQKYFFQTTFHFQAKNINFRYIFHFELYVNHVWISHILCVKYVSVFGFIHHCLYNSKVKLFKLMVLNPCLLTKHFFGLFTTPFSLTLGKWMEIKFKSNYDQLLQKVLKISKKDQTVKLNYLNYKNSSDQFEPSWLEPQLELKDFQLGSARDFFLSAR